MTSALETLRRWTGRPLGLFARGDRVRPGVRGDSGLDEVRELALRALARDLEDGLRDIDFVEVTCQDRITFVESVVAWQVRRALNCGRFDLAIEIHRFGVERIARLYERTQVWRPALLYGVPRDPPGSTARPRGREAGVTS